jgi:YrbI family 3-deoxy-D-manno-octulosonate 8-phosphate phosphatase
MHEGTYIPPLEVLRGIKLLVFDFDGVFTDNTVYVDQNGRETVRCWRSDGLGLAKLRDVGLPLLVISTEKNPVVAVRCKKLGLPVVHGVADKLQELMYRTAEVPCSMSQVAYMGNDENDLSCLSEAGIAIVPADAHESVFLPGVWRTHAPGGKGCVREVCELFHAALTCPQPVY